MIQLPSITQYLLETSISLGIFYFLYKILFSKNTFFQINRIYLIFGLLVSFTIPVLHFSLQKENAEILVPIISNAEYFTYTFNLEMEKPSPTFSLKIGQLVLFVYFLGVLFFSFRFFRRLFFVYNSIKNNVAKKENKVSTLSTNKQDTSSFFNWIFFNPRHEHSSLIMEHEMVHVREKHSIDVVLVEIFTIFNWFNPIIHLYNRSIR